MGDDMTQHHKIALSQPLIVELNLLIYMYYSKFAKDQILALHISVLSSSY